MNAKDRLVGIINKFVPAMVRSDEPLYFNNKAIAQAILSEFMLKSEHEESYKDLIHRTESEHQKEIDKIRYGCMLTHGITHPEIYKCEHEVELDKLRTEIQPILDVYEKYKEVFKGKLTDRMCRIMAFDLFKAIYHFSKRVE